MVLRQHQHLARRFCYHQDLDSFKECHLEATQKGGHCL